MSVLNIQKTYLDYKILMSNIRSEIWNDHKVALYDTSKIFETIVKQIYNIYYETEDFELFKKINNPSIDIISIKKNIVVSVKSSPFNQNKKEIDKNYCLFLDTFPLYKNYEFVLQELCDEPKNKINSPKVNPRYFDFILNLFNDDINKLKLAMELSFFKTPSIKTKSILSYYYHYYLVDIGIYISYIYGHNVIKTENIARDYEFKNLNLDVANQFRNVIEPKCMEMWNEIRKKQYLYADFENIVISTFDKLWWAGYRNYSFNFKAFYDRVLTYNNDTVKLVEKSKIDKDIHPLYFFHSQLIELLECLKQIQDILKSWNYR